MQDMVFIEENLRTTPRSQCNGKPVPYSVSIPWVFTRDVMNLHFLGFHKINP